MGKTQIRVLFFDKISIIVLAKYSNFNNILLTNNTVKFYKYTDKNNYVIKQKKDKQLLFKLITI